MSPLPCPVHQPLSWQYRKNEHRVDHRIDWNREAEIAKAYCAECSQPSSEGVKP